MQITKSRLKEILIEEILETAKRDYKAEYKKFQSSKKSKKNRAELNAYNRKKGTYGNGDGKDASHKGGKIVGYESESKNRGRAEKSRLKKEDFGSSVKQLPKFSSKEAKKVVDVGLRMWAKDLRKVEYRVIKDWMSKAKSGVIDYFDIVRGLQTGDASRAHPFESRFLKGILDRDKIMNRFRSYFGGKKGKPRK